MNGVTSNTSTWKFRKKHLASSFFCCIVFLVAIALTRPFVELATNDDWSYGQTAMTFARTGHIAYNGWANPMLGWQALWSTLFIKLLGSTFLALRVSIIAIGALTTLLLHRVLLRFGVSSANAALGTLTVVLSPLFVPLAASFMTDIPCVFCVLLCIYGCQRALRSARDRTAMLWLCASAALNVLDGTVRQIVWLGALVIVPCAFWLLRTRRLFVLVGVLTWIASFIGIALFVRWYQQQPYSLAEHILGGPISAEALRNVRRAIVFIVLSTVLYTLPVLVAWLPSLLAVRKMGRIVLTTILALLGPLLLWLDRHGKLRSHLPPWTPNVVSKYGLFWSMPSLGTKQVVLGPGLCTLVAVVLGMTVCAFLISRVQAYRRPARAEQLDEVTLTWRETVWLLVPFSLSYVTAVLPRAAFTYPGVYDRYYIPLILTAIVLLLRLYETETKGTLPPICFVTLSIFTLFSIAGTHDMFVEYRAIASAIQQVRATNVPATSISGGWVYDAWNQIEAEGHVNEPHLINPPGSYHAVLHPTLENCHYWFGPWVPAVHARYVVVAEPLSCLERSQFPDVTYTTWLPPYSRRVLVERNSEEK